MKSRLQTILCLLLSVLLCCPLLAACSRQPEAPSPPIDGPAE